MTLHLYNTLTRKKEAFHPIDEKNVRMYVCGPTVYDFAHIGNARPAIVFDVLFRLLRHLAKKGEFDGGKGETKVTYVRNITDVDDKINDRALRDFGDEITRGELTLNQAIRKVTEKTANQYFHDTESLGCLKPDYQPRATEHIDDMIELIQKLLDQGHAYIAAGPEGIEVLFSTISMGSNYGLLSRRKLDEQQAGARVVVEAHKKSPSDFVLWKESSSQQPGWSAVFTQPGGFPNNLNEVTIRGRPGWHIECSAMSWKKLGATFDIHGGGLDLIFPHHENEIAQSRCAHGTDVMARYWMHNGFLQVEGKKMSKSDGNFYTIQQLLSQNEFGSQMWHGKTLRLAMLMTHYRQPIDWTVDRLVEARKLLNDWIVAANGYGGKGKVAEEIVLALKDDLNSSDMLTILHAHYREAKSRLNPKACEQLAAALEFLGLWDGEAALEIMGHGVSSFSVSREAIVRLIEDRLVARHQKNWAESDRIRDELSAMGIQIKDNKDGTTSWEVKR